MMSVGFCPTLSWTNSQPGQITCAWNRDFMDLINTWDHVIPPTDYSLFLPGPACAASCSLVLGSRKRHKAEWQSSFFFFLFFFKAAQAQRLQNVRGEAWRSFKQPGNWRSHMAQRRNVTQLFKSMFSLPHMYTLAHKNSTLFFCNSLQLLNWLDSSVLLKMWMMMMLNTWSFLGQKNKIPHILILFLSLSWRRKRNA